MVTKKEFRLGNHSSGTRKEENERENAIDLSDDGGRSNVTSYNDKMWLCMVKSKQGIFIHPFSFSLSSKSRTTANFDIIYAINPINKNVSIAPTPVCLATCREP